MSDSLPIRRALISVSDKTGLAELGLGLQKAGVHILSTGGTAEFLRARGIEVTDVSQYTNFPEVMHGRVKTLHPKIFGGILARRNELEDLQAMQSLDISSIELVVVNLYPFESTIAKRGTTRQEAIEQIDIGGPSLIRAAAKNHEFITVVTNPEQYASVLDEIDINGCTTLATRKRLAIDAFAMTSSYDSAITEYLRGDTWTGDFPSSITISMERKSQLRYGENPHQKAAVYQVSKSRGAGLVNARQVSGKELSYNNLLDLDSALSIVRAFSQPACAVIKHNNPCGAAASHRQSLATRKALDGDPVSAFGAVLGFNTTVDEETAEVLVEPGRFIEAIVAPDFEASAVGILTSKPKWRDSIRLMQVGFLSPQERELSFRFVNGGVLVQEADVLPPSPLQWNTVTNVAVADELWDDIAFGWEMVRHVKSNAIVLAKDTALIGVGAGQMSRVDSVEIAIDKAGDRVAGSVLASDAFFPFPDSIERAATAGIVAIIQPGGSKRDDEVIAACNRHRMPMIFTGRRHFKH
ncbi:MAG: Bifunctional purine biosynthesis protein PurH [Planctomycetota bacterium]